MTRHDWTMCAFVVSAFLVPVALVTDGWLEFSGFLAAVLIGGCLGAIPGILITSWQARR